MSVAPEVELFETPPEGDDNDRLAIWTVAVAGVAAIAVLIGFVQRARGNSRGNTVRGPFSPGVMSPPVQSISPSGIKCSTRQSRRTGVPHPFVLSERHSNDSTDGDPISSPARATTVQLLNA